MNVLVTGASGNLARVVLPLLCADAEIQQVVGIDKRPIAFRHAKFVGLQLDVASAPALKALTQMDAVVHLAYVLLRGGMSADEMASTNVEATRTYLGAAARCGLKRIIFMSSAAVYGAGEKLTEAAPLAPLPGFLYAEHKAECERWLAEHIPQAVRLRPHIVLGPHAAPALKQFANLRFYPRLPNPPPLLQCVHEIDVAKAVMQALRSTVSGPFNLAAPDSFTLREMIKSRHGGATGLPAWMVRFGLWLAWRLKGWGGEPGWHAALASNLTLDCSRAAHELGWRPGFADWRAILRTSSS